MVDVAKSETQVIQVNMTKSEIWGIHMNGAMSETWGKSGQVRNMRFQCKCGQARKTMIIYQSCFKAKIAH